MLYISSSNIKTISVSRNTNKSGEKMLNTHQLNVFVVATETLNFTKTAKRLHLTQSSVSQHIKALEQKLGMALFARRGRTLEITDAGKYFLPMAREIVDNSIRAAEQMELLKEEVHGHLVVGCITAPGKYVLPSLLAEFHKKYPKVRISCEVLPMNMTMDGLSNGSTHFAFTNVDALDHRSAEFQLYLKEPIDLIVHPEHPWAEQGVISVDELRSGQFIMREKDSGTYMNVKSALKDVGLDIENLDTIMEMGSAEGAVLAVQQNLGVSFVSKMVHRQISRDKVVPVQIEGVEILQNIYFGRQTSKPSNNAQAAFWEFINNLDKSVFEEGIY
jgi:DNA-binding transcriptional LysR family regulator